MPSEITGNASYLTAGYTAQAAETSLTKKFRLVWGTAHPLLSVIHGNKRNFNTAPVVGQKLLVPINGGEQATAAAGVADADELTAISAHATIGFTQAEYPFTHYRATLSIRASERKFAMTGNTRGNFLEGKVNQLAESFKNKLSTDIAGSAVASRTALMGVRYLTSTSNSPGGIAQSEAWWAAIVQTGAGGFTLDILDNNMDAVRAEGRDEVDLLLLAYSSSNNLFGKARSAIAPAERYENTDNMVKYGLKGFEYAGAMCVLDNRGTAGEIIGLSTNTWFYGGDEKPVLHKEYTIPGTDADEMSFKLFGVLGCNDPACNFRVTGVV